MKNLQEIKDFEKALHVGSSQPHNRSTTSRSSRSKGKSMSMSPKKSSLQKPTKIIQKTVKIPITKKPMIQRRGRKART